jgi:L-2-hydroxyglutarate oxidase LhgO
VETIDVAVIGGGVTGLSSARAVARRGYSTCLLERHPRAGLDTSTRNSGVIHAGIYYPSGSLKARLCLTGARLLYEFCTNHDVPHARTGKLVVAADSREVAELETLKVRGDDNGVQGLELVDAAFIAAREPHVRGIAALYSPASGIVDAEALVRALVTSAEACGAIFLPATRLLSAQSGSEGIVLRTERERILARQVVNAAGLYADDVARLLGGERFTIYPCRGEYAELIAGKRPLVNGLVYPLPHRHGLGVHLLKTTNGEVRLGPTSSYQDRKDDYESGRLPIEAFLEPARRLLNGIELSDLRLSSSGIRPKLHPPEKTFADFMIRRDTLNRRVVHAAGIESPGLTSCLAVGELVADIVSAEPDA